MKPKKEIRNWYRFDIRNETNVSEADLNIYDVIGASWFEDGVTAKSFITDLMALPASVQKINVHINSPGGNAFDAIAIANALKTHPAEVAVNIVGLAASAATLVAMAGDTVAIAENALFMIHEPYGYVMGGAGDMRAQADALDRVIASMLATYKWHSPLEDSAIASLLKETTWMSAAEALANGFVTVVNAEEKAAAHLDSELLDSFPVPDRFSSVLDGALIDGVDKSASAPEPAVPSPPALPSAKVVNMDDFRAKVVSERDAAFAAYVKEVNSRCLAINKPQLAGQLIAENLTIENLGARIIELAAAADANEIDNKHSGAPAVKRIDVNSIYQNRRAKS